MAEKSKDEMTQEEREEKAKEIARAWIIGQRFAKRKLDKNALQHVQKEKEKEELEEIVDEIIEEVTEGGGESSQESSQEEEE